MKTCRGKTWNGSFSFVPSSITLCNMLCGLSAILVLQGSGPGEPAFPFPAIWLIIAAMVFDLFDGFAARKLNASSLRGLQLDSLSDMLSFGVAPAVLIWITGQAWWAASFPGSLLAWSASGFYAACTLWRLARFNTRTLSPSSGKGDFTGLPSPAAALAICSVLLLLDRIDPGARTVAVVSTAYAFAIGFLMVSEFEYSHIKKLARTGPVAMRVLAALLMIGACIQFGAIALFALVYLYVFSGPISGLLLKEGESSDPVSEFSHVGN